MQRLAPVRYAGSSSSSPSDTSTISNDFEQGVGRIVYGFTRRTGRRVESLADKIGQHLARRSKGVLKSTARPDTTIANEDPFSETSSQVSVYPESLPSSRSELRRTIRPLPIPKLPQPTSAGTEPSDKMERVIKWQEGFLLDSREVWEDEVSPLEDDPPPEYVSRRLPIPPIRRLPAPPLAHSGSKFEGLDLHNPSTQSNATRIAIVGYPNTGKSLLVRWAFACQAQTVPCRPDLRMQGYRTHHAQNHQTCRFDIVIAGYPVAEPHPPDDLLDWAQAVILTYSLSSYESLDQAEALHAVVPPGRPCTLLANECLLVSEDQRKISLQAGEQTARHLECGFTQLTEIGFAHVVFEELGERVRAQQKSIASQPQPRGRQLPSTPRRLPTVSL
ncbi:hypothetical protein DL96DRAFT_1639277 [Flagelloscypha sp. PMI_526]|nr:hypothetical protein DL96DRAFT_1639277 [Flagelloscypha sp. PMI_526]